ncbi:MAG TPA: hypothetical protein VNW23_08355 [Opitutaceae bacterium]|jgi:hypothetical protein|nr:hypothetical protein [Opitutaceae bacterium]
MNKFYLLVPVILLALFVAYYSQFSKQQDLIKQQQQQVEEQKKIDDDNAKKIASEKAAKDALIREQHQREEEARLEADHLSKWKNSIDKIKAETAQLQQDADAFAKQAADLEIELDSLQTTHETASRDLFDLQKQIELAKIDRRIADMEIQRTYDQVLQRVAASSMTYTPPPADPAK